MFWQANKDWLSPLLYECLKWSLDFILLAIEDALQGVEVTGYVALKTVMMYCLSVFESNICFFLK